MRNKIFISHATPDDNDFTKWLSIKLIALGYEIWCDLFFLEKGVDFWNYLSVWMDGIVFKVHDNGKIINKRVYSMCRFEQRRLKRGIGHGGRKNESAAFWMGV